MQLLPRGSPAPHSPHPPPLPSPPTLLPTQVCHKVLGDLHSSLSAAQRKDLTAIEERLGSMCEKPTGGEKEIKFCYYVDPIKREISQPLKNGVPVNLICQRLKKKAPEICALKYASAPASVTVTKDNIAKLRVKDLKAFIAEKSIPCPECIEKDDFVAAVTRYFAAHPEL